MVKTLDPEKHSSQRLRLLAEARRLFAAHGVKETSMSQIARACRVTKATLYHYFTAKDAILKELLENCGKDGEALMVHLTQAADLQECLCQIARSHLDEMKKPENLELMKILLSETMKNPHMRKFYMGFTEENLKRGALEILAPFLKRAVPERELRLVFFQFLASLTHYTWHVKMVGQLEGVIGDDEAFARQLAKTYALTLQQL